LPSHVRVTNLENGKSIVVRVNDRGPFIPGRVLDLSTGAARALGMEKEGVALVRIVVLPG
jgi:rare lipoprotein A